MKTQYAIYKYFLSRLNFKCVDDIELIKVFDDFYEANNFYRNSVAEFVKAFNFSDNDYSYHKDLSNNIDKFLKDKIPDGNNYFYYHDLNKDDLVEFAKEMELKPYELEVLQESDKQYAIWLNYANRYLFTIHEDLDILVESKKDLQIFIDVLNKYSPTGILEELSDKPILLNSYLIQKTVNYVDNRLQIVQNADEFTRLSYSYLNNVNYVLKNSWYEIHHLTSDEILKIQNENK